MKQTNDRTYTSYLALTGATPERGGMVCTHVRIDVYHRAGDGYYLTVRGVERQDNGLEVTSLTSERTYRGVLAKLNFHRGRLKLYATAVENCLTNEQGSAWDIVMGVVIAHGAQVAQ